MIIQYSSEYRKTHDKLQKFLPTIQQSKISGSHSRNQSQPPHGGLQNSKWSSSSPKNPLPSKKNAYSHAHASPRQRDAHVLRGLDKGKICKHNKSRARRRVKSARPRRRGHALLSLSLSPSLSRELFIGADYCATNVRAVYVTTRPAREGQCFRVRARMCL